MSQTYIFLKGKHKVTLKDTNTQTKKQLDNKQHIFKDTNNLSKQFKVQKL
jgi:hypothetical protein